MSELGEAHERMRRQQGRARPTAGLLVVDLDECGVVANGKTYAFHRKAEHPRNWWGRRREEPGKSGGIHSSCH